MDNLCTREMEGPDGETRFLVCVLETSVLWGNVLIMQARARTRARAQRGLRAHARAHAHLRLTRARTRAHSVRCPPSLSPPPSLPPRPLAVLR